MLNIDIKNNLYRFKYKFNNRYTYSIIGDNGVGKSTLIKYIYGIYESEGNISLDNKVLNKRNKEYIQSNISYIYNQINYQFITETVIDELLFKQERVKKPNFDKVISKFNNYNVLKIDINASISSLTKEEKILVLIMSKILNNEKVLILDEVFVLLNEDLKLKILKIIKELNILLIIITNNISDTKYTSKTIKISNKKNILLTNKELSKKVKFNSNVILKDINIDSKKEYKNSLVIDNNLMSNIFTLNVMKLLEYYKIDTTKFLKDLSNFNINEDILTQDITTLSTGELIILNILVAKNNNIKTIIFYNSFETLSKDNAKLILDLLKSYKVVIYTADINSYLLKKGGKHV
ncbi:MAG: ATP-binding cassette domain-containing protein [Mycoplasmatales bacterium]